MTMEHIKELFLSLGKHFERMAEANAVVAKPLSVGERHVIPLCELSLAFGGGGGTGEMEAGKQGQDKPSGTGGGAGGGAKASPVAVLVVDGGKVRLEKIGD
jgi:uncharacterized spore protein YtfJ